MTDFLEMSSIPLGTSASDKPDYEESPKNRQGYNCNESTNSSDDDAPASKTKKRIRRFSVNSSDEENVLKASSNVTQDLSDNGTAEATPKPIAIKSRIRVNSSSSSSSDEDSSKNNTIKSKYTMRVKKNSFRDKFKKMVANEEKTRRKMMEIENENDKSEADISKEKIKEKSSHISLSVCDPDDSEDESSTIDLKKIKKKSKVKYTDPKPMRMSAKEAMENMQKIKSESNRMLREKEVSLPYHRPKALSLKDIMSRRKPAVSSDGKSLPIKMNEEQLRNYAKLLEERQKEMMELCKSESEEDENPEPVESINIENSDHGKAPPSREIMEENNTKADSERTADMAETNDMSFDKVVNENTDTSDKSTDKIENLSDNADLTSKSQEIRYLLRKDNVSSPNKDEIGLTENSEELKEIISMNEKNISKNNAEESQMMCLHYDSEKPDTTNDLLDDREIIENKKQMDVDFSDNEINYDDIDALIENAEIVEDSDNQPRNATKKLLNIKDKPKLTGGPGMVISLDDDDVTVKPSGVELLKERFTFFANLKKEEDMEKDREKQFKPGTQHIKLKQQLEDEIAEQRSIEWEKRLEEEKLLKSEQKEILGDDSVDDIDEIEKKLNEKNDDGAKSGDDDAKSGDESDNDDDLIENDVDMSDKPQKRNAMIEDEAEESDDENCEELKGIENDGDEGDEANLEDEESDSSESSESDDEIDELKPKKGRILKAFEDSDEEDNDEKTEDQDDMTKITKDEEIVKEKTNTETKQSQDEELQLAQGNTSISEDIFSTQESSSSVVTLNKISAEMTSGELGTFSILTSSKNENTNIDKSPEKLSVICETQPDSVNFDDIAGMCSGSFSQNIVPTQIEKSQLSPSQEIGDDIAALCTGKFYDNQFVSQTDLEAKTITFNKDALTPSLTPNLQVDNITKELSTSKVPDQLEDKSKENEILKSILDELDDPDYDKPKQNKFFPSREDVKKRFVIDSDEELNEGQEESRIKKIKKKRKLEDRALQISDDEDQDEDIASDGESEVEDNLVEKLYEYDSEENEIEVQAKPQKKKRVGDFFENEAELTSEDEWAGSGDEDEAGLDRMEREEGDDEEFHQGKLQRELGQIHMREVLDQDKREVRLIQELLFEDADLGDGHRQRKFRWKNIDGEDETGMAVDEFGDTQEDEFESEELWRKQRHEREMFLRKMKEEGKEDDLNTSINRTTIIKANLISRTMSNLIAETEKKTDKENAVVPEKKQTSKDIPSPKKSFAIFKQNYHGSLLTRGRGALARLAALATPLAGDDDAPNRQASATGNFVFAAAEEPKPKKRKAEVISTPQLIKKMKTEEFKKTTLFDRLKD